MIGKSMILGRLPGRMTATLTGPSEVLDGMYSERRKFPIGRCIEQCGETLDAGRTQVSGDRKEIGVMRPASSVFPGKKYAF